MSTKRSRWPAPRIPQCPDGRVDKERGLVPGNWNAICGDRSAWVPGKEAGSLATGLDLAGRLTFPITALRCPRRGLLRSSAFRPKHRHG
ncbi:MAG: hypothetical protein ACK4L7_08065 [Flavobacteriales bacterium]